MLRDRTAHTAPPRRRRSLDRVVTVVASASLALIGVATASVLLAGASGYAGGVVLGAGVAAVAWEVLRIRRRWSEPRARVPGRSHTLDCRRARWYPPEARTGRSRFPAPVERRVVPCRNSRYFGR